MPDEKDWAMHILETIEMASMFHEDGWDSNQYAREEASNCANGRCHPRWSTQDGKTLFEKYLDRAKRQRREVQTTMQQTGLRSTSMALWVVC